MVPPAAPVVGELDGEIDLGHDRFPRPDRARQGDDHDRVDLGVERERGPTAGHADLGHLHPSALRVHRLVGAEPQHLQRLRQDLLVLVGHLVARIDVEDQLARRRVRPIREPDPLPRRDDLAVEVEPRIDLVARQPRGDRQPRPLVRREGPGDSASGPRRVPEAHRPGRPPRPPGRTPGPARRSVAPARASSRPILRNEFGHRAEPARIVTETGGEVSTTRARAGHVIPLDRGGHHIALPSMRCSACSLRGRLTTPDPGEFALLAEAE